MSLSISIFSRTALSISISISIFSRMVISISIFSISVDISIIDMAFRYIEHPYLCLFHVPKSETHSCTKGNALRSQAHLKSSRSYARAHCRSRVEQADCENMLLQAPKGLAGFWGLWKVPNPACLVRGRAASSIGNTEFLSVTDFFLQKGGKPNIFRYFSWYLYR